MGKFDKNKDIQNEKSSLRFGDRCEWKIDVFDKVDAAIVASLQAELLERITGRPLHKQTPQWLGLVIAAVSDL